MDGAINAEKYVSLSAKISLGILATALAAAQLTFTEVHEALILTQARNFVAVWFFCNANLNSSQAHFYMMKPGEKQVPPTYEVGDYPDIGSVSINQDTNHVVVNVEIKDVFAQERSEDDSPFTVVLNPRGWKREIGKQNYLFLKNVYQDEDLRSWAEMVNSRAKTKDVQKAIEKGSLHPSYAQDPRIQLIVGKEYPEELNLAALARQLQLPVPEHDDKKYVNEPWEDLWGAQLYHEIEQRYYERTVSIPLIDLKLTPLLSIIALSLIDTALCIVLLSSLRTISQKTNVVGAEPWIVLDAKGFFPRVLSAIWTAVTVMGPPLICLASIAFIAADRFYISANYEPRRDNIAMCALGVATAICFYCGVRIYILLRKIRQTQTRRLGKITRIRKIKAWKPNRKTN